jgi:hypothetical protein
MHTRRKYLHETSDEPRNPIAQRRLSMRERKAADVLSRKPMRSDRTAPVPVEIDSSRDQMVKGTMHYIYL